MDGHQWIERRSPVEKLVRFLKTVVQKNTEKNCKFYGLQKMKII